MKNFFRCIHLWLSVPFGILITIICLSGAALVFEAEVTAWCHPHLYYVSRAGDAPLPEAELRTLVAATLPDSVKITGLVPSNNPLRTWQVRLSKPRKASLYVNPYTGEVAGRKQRMPFFQTMFGLHRWLLHTPAASGNGSAEHGNSAGIRWGKLTVGISTLMFVFVLISGIVIWWPRTKKALKNSLKITFRRGWRTFNYQLHVAGSLYALLFLLLMILTGLTWSFPWYRIAFYDLLGLFAPADELRGLVYSLHVGDWGGLTTRILYFVASLVGAALPLTGYYLWWRRLRRSVRCLQGEQ